MSSVIDNEKTKKKCQVFTPTAVVEDMLDHLNYQNNLMGKKVLENSCGDGQFLVKIVKRYIDSSKSEGFSDEEIGMGLSSDVYGIELDETHFDKCIENLNMVINECGIKEVKWQIYNRDALRNPIEEKFDFIVGNPPYISYWDMDESERSYIKENYSTCNSGAFDYSYAFIEECLLRLSDTGRLVYIVPNSLFKTSSGKKLRRYMLPHLCAIYDYTTAKIFEGVLTTPAIIVADKSFDVGNIKYKDMSTNLILEIDKKKLADKWVFRTSSPVIKKSQGHRFGDCFNASISIATQRNRAFVLSGWQKKDDYLFRGSERVEWEAVKNAASPRSKKRMNKEYIIFPYSYVNGSIVRFSEQDYMNKYPLAYNYLLGFKDELLLRDSDKSAQWFEYGRSQALHHVWQKKLLISTLITGAVHVYDLEESEIPYSGIYITAKDAGNDLSLGKAKEILGSQDFMEYAQQVGISASGKTIRITPSNICDYCW
ncbi:Eco57I restriction-modification methylase domain-containing protein [Eggerthella guodeyinii]|uniref:site-specific DNA-methyltransferase (adenine-specific) n=1 Tax=Eggerthella guodeyinii TaxID=2690837 RepID=A0A6N7RQE9_9ACTN|nr:N-6 DNA methylase [Eggerthella guodeyinii]MRX82908.1 N-6 DNA methylase [Eggerthella guodeyinii]